MSTAKGRKTTRPATRKRKSADAAVAPTDESMAAEHRESIPSVEEAPLSSSSTTDASPTDDAQDEIRLRAYELYVSRGAADGDDLSDWLEAERLVRGSRRSPTDVGRDDVRSEPPSA